MITNLENIKKIFYIYTYFEDKRRAALRQCHIFAAYRVKMYLIK